MKDDVEETAGPHEAADDDVEPAPGRKLKAKAYDKELRRLQAELCRLQDWVKAKHFE